MDARESLQLEINRKLILLQGSNPTGNRKELVKNLLSQYDLSTFEIVHNPHNWTIRLTTPEHEQERQQAIENEYTNKAAKERFTKRVKAGKIESSITAWIDKNYPDLEVRHSHSFVNSESFYIYEKGSSEALIKLSLHNTQLQQLTYNTPFCDLSTFTSTIDLKRYLKQFLTKH